MNIHGARRAGRRRRKACMGWSWAAACGVQGRGHIARLPAQFVNIEMFNVVRNLKKHESVKGSSLKRHRHKPIHY